MRPLFAALCLLALPLLASAGEFRVGPGQTYATIGAVPWETLGPGDTVLIHARPTPYTEKWVIGRSGTQAEPITVRGVPDAQGNLPIIHGEGATTRSPLNYWNEERGIIKIGGSNTPADTLPSYLVIEGLHLRRARGAFTGRNGASSYNANAAGIFIEKGQHIVIRGCILEDNGNGLFIANSTSDVLVEGNSIHGNGNSGSILEHNTYTEARSDTRHLATLQWQHSMRRRATKCPLSDEEAKVPGLEWGTPSPAVEASCRCPAWQSDPSG